MEPGEGRLSGEGAGFRKAPLVVKPVGPVNRSCEKAWPSGEQRGGLACHPSGRSEAKGSPFGWTLYLCTPVPSCLGAMGPPTALCSAQEEGSGASPRGQDFPQLWCPLWPWEQEVIPRLNNEQHPPARDASSC